MLKFKRLVTVYNSRARQGAYSLMSDMAFLNTQHDPTGSLLSRAFEKCTYLGAHACNDRHL